MADAFDALPTGRPSIHTQTAPACRTTVKKYHSSYGSGRLSSTVVPLMIRRPVVVDVITNATWLAHQNTVRVALVPWDLIHPWMVKAASLVSATRELCVQDAARGEHTRGLDTIIFGTPATYGATAWFRLGAATRAIEPCGGRAELYIDRVIRQVRHCKCTHRAGVDEGGGSEAQIHRHGARDQAVVRVVWALELSLDVIVHHPSRARKTTRTSKTFGRRPGRDGRRRDYVDVRRRVAASQHDAPLGGEVVRQYAPLRDCQRAIPGPRCRPPPTPPSLNSERHRVQSRHSAM